jgi:hypothetical protein
MYANPGNTEFAPPPFVQDEENITPLIKICKNGRRTTQTNPQLPQRPYRTTLCAYQFQIPKSGQYPQRTTCQYGDNCYDAQSQTQLRREIAPEFGTNIPNNFRPDNLPEMAFRHLRQPKMHVCSQLAPN